VSPDPGLLESVGKHRHVVVVEAEAAQRLDHEGDVVLRADQLEIADRSGGIVGDADEHGPGLGGGAAGETGNGRHGEQHGDAKRPGDVPHFLLNPSLDGADFRHYDLTQVSFG
jgi:hypothetical protein